MERECVALSRITIFKYKTKMKNKKREKRKGDFEF